MAERITKHAWFDSKRVCVILALMVAILAIALFSPALKDNPVALEQTARFASYLERSPDLVQSLTPSKEFSRLPGHSPPPAGIGPDSTPFDRDQAFSIKDRQRINRLVTQWNSHEAVRAEAWRDQMEEAFSIAENSHSTDVYDVLRHQIMLGGFDEDPINRARAEAWFQRYMKMETRPVPRKELQDVFQPKLEAIPNERR